MLWLQIWHAFLSVFQVSRSYRSVLFFRFVCSFTRGDTHSCCRLNFFYQGVSVCSDCVQCDWQPKTDDFLDKRRKPITWPHHTSWARWRVDPRHTSHDYQHAEHFKCNVCRHRWLPVQCKLCASGGDEKRQQVCPFRSARLVKTFLERERSVCEYECFERMISLWYSSSIRKKERKKNDSTKIFSQPLAFKGPSVITDICEKMKTHHFFWTPPPPAKRHVCFIIQDRYFLEMRSIHIMPHSLQWLVSVLVSIACSQKVSCRTCAADATVIHSVGVHCGSRRFIEAWWKCCASTWTWRKCCASRLDETAVHSVPAAHRYFFKKRTWPKPPLPQIKRFRFFFFSQISFITDGP